MPELTTIEIRGPVTEVLSVLLHMRGTKQTTRVGEISRLRIGRATATVFWAEDAQLTVVHVRDPHHTEASTSACARLIAKLPHPVSRFDTGPVLREYGHGAAS